MTIFVDQVETIGKGLFAVQITIGPPEPDRDFPSVRVRVPMREDEISTLSLREIHDRALRKVPDLCGPCHRPSTKELVHHRSDDARAVLKNSLRTPMREKTSGVRPFHCRIVPLSLICSS